MMEEYKFGIRDLSQNPCSAIYIWSMYNFTGLFYYIIK